MNAKISLRVRVFFLVYAYSENTGKVLSLYREYSEFRVAVHKIISKNAERIYAYMEKTPKGAKLCISPDNEKTNFKFFGFFYLHYCTWDGLKSKSNSRYTFSLMILYNIDLYVYD